MERTHSRGSARPFARAVRAPGAAPRGGVLAQGAHAPWPTTRSAATGAEEEVGGASGEALAEGEAGLLDSQRRCVAATPAGATLAALGAALAAEEAEGKNERGEGGRCGRLPARRRVAG